MEAVTKATAKERPKVEDHGPIWRAIRALEGKVNYILGALAILIPLNVGVFIAVILK